MIFLSKHVYYNLNKISFKDNEKQNQKKEQFAF